jgi:hypothetical protein
MKQNTFYAMLTLAAAMIVVSCQKNITPDVPQKDLADNFVGTYQGFYKEFQQTDDYGSGHGYDFEAALSINKKSAKDVLVHIEDRLGKKLFDLNGVAKNDSVIEFPIQTINGQIMQDIGSGLLTFRLEDTIITCKNDTIMGLNPNLLKFYTHVTVKSATSTIFPYKISFRGQK